MFIYPLVDCLNAIINEMIIQDSMEEDKNYKKKYYQQ